MGEQNQNLRLRGQGISIGLAMGKALAYRDILHDLEIYEIASDEVDAEHARLERARNQVLGDLRVSAERVEAELDAGLALIFRAHEAMLSDPVLSSELRSELEQELVNAEQVVRRVFRRWERRLRAATREENRERGDDMVDLGRRLLRALLGVREHVLEDLPANTVLVARRLLPSDTVHISRNSVVAVVVEFGGPASHAALLTREMGIPAVAQINSVHGVIAPGDVVLVDGFAGEVLVNPDEENRSHFQQRVEQHVLLATSARARCREPCKTRDGLAVSVMANIGCHEDAVLAMQNGADGIGLFRMEPLYLSRQVLPAESELVESLRLAISPVSGRPITFRLLDSGGDKRMPSLNLSSEVNPFLGRRGVRLLLAYPELVHTQLRALLHLAQDEAIQILVPMVTVADEVRRIREMLQSAARDLGASKIPELGAMIETPAAALCAKDIAKHVDFLSIGTNDLTQYTMAAGREDPQVSDYFRDDHPAIWRLIRWVTEAAGPVPVSLCGELAGRVHVLRDLVAIGIRSLSVAPPLVPTVKEAIRNISVADSPLPGERTV